MNKYGDDKWAQEWKQKELEKNEVLLSLIPARAQDYNFWLNRFLAKGGKVTHQYEYNLPNDFYVAKSDFTLAAFFGAQSFNIIIPAGIQVLTHDTGHCELFFNEDFTFTGHGWVPQYLDWAPCQVPFECKDCDCKVFCVGISDAGTFGLKPIIPKRRKAFEHEHDSEWFYCRRRRGVL